MCNLFYHPICWNKFHSVTCIFSFITPRTNLISAYQGSPLFCSVSHSHLFSSLLLSKWNTKSSDTANRIKTCLCSFFLLLITERFNKLIQSGSRLLSLCTFFRSVRRILHITAALILILSLPWKIITDLCFCLLLSPPFRFSAYQELWTTGCFKGSQILCCCLICQNANKN